MKRLIAILIALAAIACATVSWRAVHLRYRGYQGQLIVEIAPRTRTVDIARTLAGKGVLARRVPFLTLCLLGRLRGRRLKAGEYEFDRPLSPLDVYRKIAYGEVYLHAVVIPEGSDRFEMARIFEERLAIAPQKFLSATNNTGLIRDLDPDAPNLEGYLFPDTYRFPKDATATTVVETMVAKFRRVLKSDLGSDPSSTPAALHDAVTLASLVEKETPDPAERPIIAGVFARRLKLGMPLECDPTVIYAARLDGRTIAPGKITESDLAFKSPYNTYLNAGLPPGPIASPGVTSLRAAFNPAPVDFLYFVSNNHGGHIFAKTLAEHLRNVARYRREVEELRSRKSGSDHKQPTAPPSPGKRREKNSISKRPGGDARRGNEKNNHSRIPAGTGS